MLEDKKWKRISYSKEQRPVTAIFKLSNKSRSHIGPYIIEYVIMPFIWSLARLILMAISGIVLKDCSIECQKVRTGMLVGFILFHVMEGSEECYMQGKGNRYCHVLWVCCRNSTSSIAGFLEQWHFLWCTAMGIAYAQFKHS